MKVQLRKLGDVLEPRRTRLQVPGWSGENTREQPQPWHCKPFCDAASYGLEVLFSWKSSCRVALRRGRPVWIGDLEAELPENAPPGWRPFSVFSSGHFGFSPLMDLKVPRGMGLFVLPHPRSLMDTTGTVPLAIPGLLETHWWPRPFFLVFRSPRPRKAIEFRNGDPLAQILVVPLREKYELVPMTEAQARSRNRRSAVLAQDGARFSTVLTPATGDYPSFDNKYKVLSDLARLQGDSDVTTLLDLAQPHPISQLTTTPRRRKAAGK